MLRLTGFALALALATACGNGSPAEVEDKNAPVLSITEPTRGTTVTGDFVTVTGSIADEELGAGSVTINGVPAEVGDDGQFTAQVPLAHGVTILETIATDAAGNQASDHRGVLAGQHAPLDTTVRDALVAELTPATFAVLGDVSAGALTSVDFEAVGERISPIVDRGNSCFGVEVDLRDVQFSELNVVLVPTEGSVNITVAASDLDVDMRANWEISCFGGGAGLNISADELVIDGTLAVELVSGRFVATLENATARFEGFDLDVGSIPDSIVNFFVDDIDQKVAGALVGAIRDVVPGVVQSTLDDFSDKQIETTLFGITMNLSFVATSVAIDENGGRVALDFAAGSPDVADATYIATPQIAPSSAVMGSQSFGVALADDVANQMLAILWHAGALDAELDVGGTPLRDIFPSATRVTIDLLLPPVITTTADSELAAIGIGDLLVTARADDGAAIAELALSGHVEVGVSTALEGNASFSATIADLSTSVLSGDDAIGLTSEQLAVFAEVGVAQVRSQIDDVLQQLTIPKFGAEVRTPSLGATRGYLLVSGQLTVE